MQGQTARIRFLLAVIILLFATNTTVAQEKSVAPEINKAFKKPDIKDFQGKFEVEGRQAFANRDAIVKARNYRPAADDLGRIGP